MKNYLTFQSRNRGSFDFKPVRLRWYRPSTQFQSRNRGSFDFKGVPIIEATAPLPCFNLVIEVLLISSREDVAYRVRVFRFQSRNRGSFDFKLRVITLPIDDLICFNLVIEVLLISSLNIRLW